MGEYPEVVARYLNQIGEVVGVCKSGAYPVTVQFTEESLNNFDPAELTIIYVT
jgi:hypothetical protein